MTLATLAEAKAHLQITDAARDAEVTQFLELASAQVFDYIGSRADPLWDEDTAPDIVQASTLYTLGHLWEHRGDDAAEQTDERFWQGLSLRLMRLRDPAIA